MKAALSRMLAVTCALVAVLGAIAMPAAAVTLLAENFDSVGAPALPAAWTATDVYGAAGEWTTATSTVHPAGIAPHSAPNLAVFNSWTASLGSATRLWSNGPLDLRGVANPTLSFWMYHDSEYGDMDTIQPQVSTDNGAHWLDAGSPVERYAYGQDGWLLHEVDISYFRGRADVRIGFLATGAYGNDCHLDDVTVTAETLAVTVNQAAGQPDPTLASPIHFTVAFSQAVTGFDAPGDVTHGGSAPGPRTATITEVAPFDGTTYGVAVTGMTGDGTVTVSVPANAVNEGNPPSSSADNRVAYGRVPDVLYTAGFDAVTPPGLPPGWAQQNLGGGSSSWVTEASGVAPSQPNHAALYVTSPGDSARLEQTAGISLRARGSAGLTFQVYHSAANPAGTAGVQAQVSTDGGATWTPVGSVTKVYRPGAPGFAPHFADLSAHAGAADLRLGFVASGEYAEATLIDDVAVSAVPLWVSVEQAAGQADPVYAGPIHFTAVFSFPVSGFVDPGDVVIGGTAPGELTATITALTPPGDGSAYDIAVSGMTGAGTVTVAIPQDAVLGGNVASASADNSVSYGAIVATALSENFDLVIPPSAFPPGWEQTAVSGVDGAWAIATGTVNPPGVAAHSGPNLAVFNAATVPPGATARLWFAGGLDLQGFRAPVLSFWMYHDEGDPGPLDMVQPQVSIDGGVTWTDAGIAFPRPAAGGAAWRRHEVDLAPYLGQPAVHVGFLGVGMGGNDCHIDDVSLIAETSASVAVQQAAGQADPTGEAAIHFTVVFSHPVTGFDATDVTLGGTAGGTLLAEVTELSPPGDRTSYDVTVWGMTTGGTVSASVPADVVAEGNFASTSVDGEVTFQNLPPQLVDPSQAITLDEDAGLFQVMLTPWFSDSDGLGFEVLEDPAFPGELPAVGPVPAYFSAFGVQPGGWTFDVESNQNYYGAHHVIVRATDTAGQSVDLPVTVEILPVPDPAGAEHSHLVWGGANWTPYYDPGTPNEYQVSARKGKAVVNLKASAFSSCTLYLGKFPGAGIAEIWVDGQLKETVDLYTGWADMGFHPFVVDGLEAKGHTVQLVATGRKGGASADTIVDLGGLTISSAPSVLIWPRDNRIAYDDWVVRASKGAAGGRYVLNARKGGAQRFGFVGRQASVTLAKGPAYGKAAIVVDGRTVKTVDLYSPTPRWKYVVNLPKLPYGAHTVSLKVTGTKNAASSGFAVVFDQMHAE